MQITELQLGKWTDDYKEFLCELCESGTIQGFKEYHTTTEVKFVVTASAAAIAEMRRDDSLTAALKLSSSISMGNMHAFDANGIMKRYSSAADIIDDHFPIRLAAYAKRKAALSRQYAVDELISRNKSLFIAKVIDGSITLFGGDGRRGGPLNEEQIVQQLRTLGFETESAIEGVATGHAPTGRFPEQGSKDFKYLLELPIHSLTDEKYRALRRNAEQAADRLKEINSRTAEDLWMVDLHAFNDVISTEMKRERA